MELTWIASAAPISYVGAQPRFAEIDPQTWCIDPASFEANITARTKAVIVVDLYGNMPQWHTIKAIATNHKIPIIEDAAEAIGSSYKGALAGSLGTTGTFSFHGSKTMTTGEGGMLVTNDEALFKRAQFLRDHGRKPGDVSFFNLEVGYKYKMSALQAALGLAQVERIDELVDKKRQIFDWYREFMGDAMLNPEPEDVRNSYWMTTLILPPSCSLDKMDLMAKMAEHQIDCRPFFHPLSSLPAYEQATDTPRARQTNLKAYDLSPRGINLPSALCLTREQVARVCEVLCKLIA